MNDFMDGKEGRSEGREGRSKRGSQRGYGDVGFCRPLKEFPSFT